MARAHGIDVQALHYLDILNHSLHRHYVAAIRVQFMTVHSLYKYRLSVYQQLASLYLHMAEAYALRDDLRHLATLADGDEQRI